MYCESNMPHLHLLSLLCKSEQYQDTELNSFHIALDKKMDSFSRVLSLYNQSNSEVMF